MDWTIIISSIGGSAVLFGTMAFLTRSIVVHFLDKDVERFKNALQLKAIEHQVRFNSLHAKRAEIIAEFYEKMVVISTVVAGLKNKEKKSFSETDKVIGDKAMSVCLDAWQFFKRNELFFDDELCAKIEKLYVLAFGEARMFAGIVSIWEEFRDKIQKRSPEAGQIFEEGMASASSKLESEIPELLKELKKRFRDILGVPQTT
jgi:hypothetical protein